jgi:hypothetical protein
MLSIIIVGWNCAAELDACLTSLRDHPPSSPVEVIYVDNASSDGSTEVVRQRCPSARIVVNRHNVGFQRANNQGLALARGRDLLLLNPDTRVLPGTLDVLVGFLRGHPEAGAASPRCIYPDGRLQWSIAPFPSLPIIRAWYARRHPLLAGRRQERERPPTPADPPTQEQAYAYGACFAIKREVAEAVGPMDEGFFLTGGEIAWSREIQRLGWKIFYVAEATIVHHESTSRRRRSVVSELDWVLAHRRLLYLYEGVRAGMVGDVLFASHLAALAVEAVGARIAGATGRPRATGRSAAS